MRVACHYRNHVAICQYAHILSDPSPVYALFVESLHDRGIAHEYRRTKLHLTLAYVIDLVPQIT